MGLAIASTSLAAVLATSAGADTSGTAYIKICKTLTPPPAGINVNASQVFTYSVTNLGSPVSVAAGTCSGIISVPVSTSGTTSLTVTETQAAWFQTTAITEPAGQNYLSGTTLSTGTTTITATNSIATGNVYSVSYTNAVVTGYVEVCKQSVSGSGLSGTYGFTLSEPSNGFSNSTSAASVGINNCSVPILVPAGQVNVAEQGTNLYVTGITAYTNGIGSTDIVGSANTVAGTVTVTVAASADTSVQTDVTYTNNVVLLEVCKTYDGTPAAPVTASTLFPFTETATGAAGPNTAPAAFSIAAGTCSAPTAYRPGTTVTVTEGIVPGSKVENITPTGAESTVPGSLSLTNRTVTIIVGTPTNSSLTLPANEAVVTFQNKNAAPGDLKICKFAGTVPGPPIGNSFTFTVGSFTTTVALGNCAFVMNGSSPALFPFNSTQTVTESASALNAASAITVAPQFVTEIVGTTPTLTSETVLSGTPNLGTTGSTSSVNVVIGENVLTETDFTDVDPPAGVTTPVTVVIPGGLGTTTAPTAGIAIQVAGSSQVTSSASAVASANPIAIAATSSSKTVVLTAAQKRAALKADKKLLSSIDNKITILQKRLATQTGTARKATLKALNTLKARQHVLKLEIKLL
jgi:hypothetical protein